MVVGETGAEHLHDIVFVGSRVTPAECHIDPLGEGGCAEGEDRSSEEGCAQRRGCFAGGDDPVAALFEAHPQIADRLRNVPPVNEKHPRRAMTFNQRREQLRQGRKEPRRTRTHLAHTV